MQAVKIVFSLMNNEIANNIKNKQVLTSIKSPIRFDILLITVNPELKSSGGTAAVTDSYFSYITVSLVVGFVVDVVYVEDDDATKLG